ncbi:MAG: LysM peptidoglycan-binding domain-containing protein [Parvularculaceae bacterium]
MTRTVLVLAGGAAALAGCATSYDTAGRDPYDAAYYTGAEQLYAADIRAAQFAPQQRSANGTPFELVSYEGIDGARRAHQLYTRAEAEALDGRCERFIEPSAAETLIDVADLCDVPLETLVAFNPDVANISYAERVVTIEIPGGKVSPRGTFAASNALAELYEVKDGDTLSSVAYRLNVSAASLANSNPDVSWTTPLSAGQVLRKPVAAASSPASAGAASANPAPYSPAEWQGYASAGRGISSGGNLDAAARHAPYTLRPTRPFAGRASANPDGADLVVDKAAVRVGDRVRVTARAEPGTDVTFYSGATLDTESGDPADRMREVATARADANGEATASVRIKRRSDMGGVIFKAVPEGRGEAVYSNRIGVINLDDAEEEDPAEDIGEE